MRHGFAAFLFLLVSAASAQKSEHVDPCASPRRFAGRWAGTMTCKSGKYPATVVVTRTEDEGVCVLASWRGKDSAPGSAGDLRAEATVKDEVFLLTSGQMTSILHTFEGGRRLTFSPDPNASVIAQLIKFSGSAKLDKDFKKAFVRYTTSTPISAPDPCQGTIRRVN